MRLQERLSARQMQRFASVAGNGARSCADCLAPPSLPMPPAVCHPHSHGYVGMVPVFPPWRVPTRAEAMHSSAPSSPSAGDVSLRHLLSATLRALLTQLCYQNGRRPPAGGCRLALAGPKPVHVRILAAGGARCPVRPQHVATLDCKFHDIRRRCDRGSSLAALWESRRRFCWPWAVGCKRWLACRPQRVGFGNRVRKSDPSGSPLPRAEQRWPRPTHAPIGGCDYPACFFSWACSPGARGACKPDRGVGVTGRACVSSRALTAARRH